MFLGMKDTVPVVEGRTCDGILLREESEVSPAEPLPEAFCVHSTIIAASPRIRQITFDESDVTLEQARNLCRRFPLGHSALICRQVVIPGCAIWFLHASRSQPD